MSHRPPAWVRRRRLAATLVVAAAGLGGYQSLASPAASPRSALPELTPGAPAAAPPVRRSSRGPAAGALPDGASVFDDALPGVAKLDSDLLAALRQAASAAAADGVELHVNSGWRSPEYQRRLLREAVARYGSEREAARWVATPETSPHASGDAVDIGPAAAATWLSAHGARFGLCQIYANEDWHFELRPGGCPPEYADPTHDPRMRP
jgi:D-alanyl-D-alanine carboxypeptidase